MLIWFVKTRIKAQSSLAVIASGLKEDFKINRKENAGIAKDNRTELKNTLKDFTLVQRVKFDELKQERKELTGKKWSSWRK